MANDQPRGHGSHWAALSLQVSRFAAKPMIITEGPAVELRREQLRQEGNPSEAERADLSVEFRMEGMCTLFSWEEGDDHHEFAGLVRAVHPLGQAQHGLPVAGGVSVLVHLAGAFPGAEPRHRAEGAL